MYGAMDSGMSGNGAQMCDDAMLCAAPEFVSLSGLLKATPATEGEDRVLYIEASNEDPDHQNEIILQKALAESAQYYLDHGNIDLSHFTILGPKVAGPNFLDFEIGKPVDVRMRDSRTFVKAILYRGESAMARNADTVWESLTKQSPAARWYPSVGGSVFKDYNSIRIDPDTGAKIVVIEKVRWNNIALDRNPVNKTVPVVTTAAQAVFAKSLNGFVLKALEASYSSNVASLTGGGALGKQSLDKTIKQTIPGGYWDFRERMAGDVKTGRIKSMNARGLVSHATGEYGVDASTAAEWVEAFLRDLHTNLKRTTQ